MINRNENHDWNEILLKSISLPNYNVTYNKKFELNFNTYIFYFQMTFK